MMSHGADTKDTGISLDIITNANTSITDRSKSGRHPRQRGGTDTSCLGSSVQRMGQQSWQLFALLQYQRQAHEAMIDSLCLRRKSTLRDMAFCGFFQQAQLACSDLCVMFVTQGSQSHGLDKGVAGERYGSHRFRATVQKGSHLCRFIIGYLFAKQARGGHFHLNDNLYICIWQKPRGFDQVGAISLGSFVCASHWSLQHPETQI